MWERMLRCSFSVSLVGFRCRCLVERASFVIMLIIIVSSSLYVVFVILLRVCFSSYVVCLIMLYGVVGLFRFLLIESMDIWMSTVLIGRALES